MKGRIVLPAPGASAVFCSFRKYRSGSHAAGCGDGLWKEQFFLLQREKIAVLYLVKQCKVQKLQRKYKCVVDYRRSGTVHGAQMFGHDKEDIAGRYVYLPREMKMFRLKRGGELESEILPAGHHYVAVELGELIFFLRKGHALPLAAGGNCVDEEDFEHLTMLAFGDGEISYRYYHDDGESRDYDDPDHISVLHVKGGSSPRFLFRPEV